MNCHDLSEGVAVEHPPTVVNARSRRLQTAAVDDLVVNSHLAAIVVDDKDTDAATAVVEAIGETAEEAALVKDR